MKLYTAIISAGVLALALSTTALAAGSTVVEPAQIAAAKTAADHEAIAKAYEEEATGLDRQAEMHSRMVDTYRANGKGVYAGSISHCAALVKDLKAAAKDNRALAADHHKLAQSAGN